MSSPNATEERHENPKPSCLAPNQGARLAQRDFHCAGIVLPQRRTPVRNHTGILRNAERGRHRALPGNRF